MYILWTDPPIPVWLRFLLLPFHLAGLGYHWLKGSKIKVSIVEINGRQEAYYGLNEVN